jgi:membrane-bound lytic murein transglycosylase D
MKRLFAFALCILSLNIVEAGSLFTAGSSSRVNKTISFVPKNKLDTIIPLSQIPVPALYQNSIFKLRLDSIKKDVPLDYNEYVQSYIDIYTRHKDEMSHVMGLAKYYFPIYEKAFREAGIPEEIKYLSIVESKLDPLAVSRVGATGPWQFMAATANCGKSSVERAIAKSGTLDFWSIRKYLPNETRGYVPAYIAISYVMNYAAKHNILPQSWDIGKHTDTVLVDRFVSLGNISKAINVDAGQLVILNPAYKKQIINGTAAVPCRLVIPQTAQENYLALYNALNTDMHVEPVLVVNTEHKLTGFHKIKRGETLAEIADNFGVEAQDLKDWNNLHGNKAVVGKKLWLNDSHETADAPTKSEAKFVTYKVKRGDTLGIIAEKFDGTTVESIRSLNGLKKGAIQPGMKLKISRG